MKMNINIPMLIRLAETLGPEMLHHRDPSEARAFSEGVAVAVLITQIHTTDPSEITALSRTLPFLYEALRDVRTENNLTEGVLSDSNPKDLAGARRALRAIVESSSHLPPEDVRSLKASARKVAESALTANAPRTYSLDEVIASTEPPTTPKYGGLW